MCAKEDGEEQEGSGCNELVWLKEANRRGLRPFVTICDRCKRDRIRFWFVLCIYYHVANIADSSTRLM